MTNGAPTTATTSPGPRLPVYALRLVALSSEREPGVRLYHGSAWREDRTQFLGGERSVFAFLHAILGKPRDQSVAWTRLYWRVRDATGWPLTRERVPARLLHDVERARGLFASLASASWCAACHGAPALEDAPCCAWCSVARVGREMRA